MSNTELIAESRSYADSLRVVMQDQAAETIESLCDALQALCAKLDKATVAIKSISNDNWPDADLNAGEYANLVLHELAAGAVDKPAASEVISESIDAAMR